MEIGKCELGILGANNLGTVIWELEIWEMITKFVSWQFGRQILGVGQFGNLEAGNFGSWHLGVGN